MAGRRSFKSDVSFLEKISMGAIGTRRVFQDLENQGHNPLELERSSMSFKIWKDIKIKRIRVPDILCVGCARRVECRTKTSFEISMSHSLSDPERGWDYGLDDNDFVALVVCKQVGQKPVDWQALDLVQYISIQELRSAQMDSRVEFVGPKGAQEGFEARLNWPTAIAKASGAVTSVTKKRIQYRRQLDNRTITLRLIKRNVTLDSLVAEGDSIVGNQAVASVVPVVKNFPCSKSASDGDYISWLLSPSLSERYTAAKALSQFGSDRALSALADIISESSEHVYVRLEAAVSLARHKNDKGWEFISQCLSDDYLQNRLEAVIGLGEIATNHSCQLLRNVLQDDRQHVEIRAGAAWALGEIRARSALEALIESFSAVNEGIRTEAARALAKLASRFMPEIVRQFSRSGPEKRPGIAWALSKSGNFKIDDILTALVDHDARHWVVYILGSQDQQRYVRDIDRLKKHDPEVFFAVTVLWKIMSSWVYDLEEHG